MFENRVLRKIFGSKREKVTVGCRILCNDKLYNLYRSPDIIEMINACTRDSEKQNGFFFFK